MDGLKEVAIEYLMGTPIGQNLQMVVDALQNAQECAIALIEKHDEHDLTNIKIGTVLVLSILKKISTGHSPENFSADDFADIAADVADFAIKLDDQSYSQFIFGLYADYINFSQAQLAAIVSKEKCEQIKALAAELLEKSEQLDKGEISEFKYTEDCLWICLEAMIKLLSAYAGSFTGPEFARLIDGITACGFEYARLCLYKKEQELLTVYLDGQQILDEKLSKQYAEYQAAFETEANKFSQLVENAFSMNIRDSLMSSVELALSSGVSSDEILKSTEDIDSYFLN